MKKDNGGRQKELDAALKKLAQTDIMALCCFLRKPGEGTFLMLPSPQDDRYLFQKKEGR